MMPVYCRGISKPPNSTIFAPRRLCHSFSGVLNMLAHLTVSDGLGQAFAYIAYDAATHSASRSGSINI